MYQENTGMYANYEVETNKEIYKESNVGKIIQHLVLEVCLEL